MKYLLIALIAAAILAPVAAAHKPRPTPPSAPAPSAPVAVGATLTGSSQWKIDPCPATFCGADLGIQPSGSYTGSLGVGSYSGSLLDGASGVPCTTASYCTTVSGQITFTQHHCTITTSAVGTAGIQSMASNETRFFTLILSVTGIVRNCPVSVGSTMRLAYTAAYNHVWLNGVPTVSFADNGTVS